MCPLPMAMIAKALSASFAVRSVALEIPGTTADLSTCAAEARVRIRRSTGGRTTMSNLPPGRAILGSIKPAVRRHRGLMERRSSTMTSRHRLREPWRGCVAGSSPKILASAYGRRSSGQHGQANAVDIPG